MWVVGSEGGLQRRRAKAYEEGSESAVDVDEGRDGGRHGVLQRTRDRRAAVVGLVEGGPAGGGGEGAGRRKEREEKAEGGTGQVLRVLFEWP